MSGDARAVAYSVVRRSLDGGAYADRALDGEATRAGLDARQRAFASFLALGTVQHLRTLDAAIAAASERSVDRLERPLLHAIRLGTFQLLFAGSVPDRAAVSETVELVRSVVGQRATGFANAVLRKVAGDGPAWLAALPEDTPEAAGLRHSLPDWVCQLWFDAFGPARALELCRAANVPARSVLRPNPLRASPGEPEAALEAAGIPFELDADGRDHRDRPVRPRGLRAVRAGPGRRAVAELDRGRLRSSRRSPASACSTCARRRAARPRASRRPARR